MEQSEIEKAIAESSDDVSKVRLVLEELHQSDIVYNKIHEETRVIDDIALIQCFYGVDINRIRATMQAIEFNLQMTKKPSTWVFVECQKNKSDCAFRWLKNYGVKYHFVKMDSSNEGIMLKNPLWNIGASLCQESRLCFLDSDVVMCNSNWVENCSTAFDNGYDVISLASHQYYQFCDNFKLHETIGYKMATSGKADKSHVGFTVGMTRNAFEKIGGLDPAIILDDVHLYHKILGDSMFKFFENWTTPFKLNARQKYGYNIELGYALNTACHVFHGDMESKYDTIVKLLNVTGFRSIYDIVDYSTKDIYKLPTWKPNPKCNALKATIERYYSYLKNWELEIDKPYFNIINEYKNELRKILGEPGDNCPLYVCTVAKDRYGLKLGDFVKFRDNVEKRFSCSAYEPIVLFFTDCQKFKYAESEINTVPLKGYEIGKEFEQCLRKDLKYPNHAMLYYVPFDYGNFEELDVDIWLPSDRIDNADGTVMVSI